MFAFSTQASLEFVFRTFKGEDANAVDVMIVGTATGIIHLCICDSFFVGSFYCPALSSLSDPERSLSTVARHSEVGFDLCDHASHPDLSTHALLFRDQEAEQENSRLGARVLYLVPLDLAFICSSPMNVSLLASKTTTLQNLLRYIQQTHSHLATEWKATRDLPDRFQRSVQSELAGSAGGPTTLVQALVHVATTGDVRGPVRNWLVDSLAERVRGTSVLIHVRPMLTCF